MYAFSISACMHIYAMYVYVLLELNLRKIRACSGPTVDTVMCKLLWAEAL